MKDTHFVVVPNEHHLMFQRQDNHFLWVRFSYMRLRLLAKPGNAMHPNAVKGDDKFNQIGPTSDGLKLILCLYKNITVRM